VLPELKINTPDWYYLDQFTIFWIECGDECVKSEENFRHLAYVQSYLTEWRREILANLSKHKEVFDLGERLETWENLFILASGDSLEDIEKWGLSIYRHRILNINLYRILDLLKLMWERKRKKNWKN
jgi:hypothetical protein